MNDDDMKPPAIVQLGPKNEFKALVEQMRRDLEDQLELGRMIAKVRRSNFLAYVAEGFVAEGFTEQQALELCLR